LYLVICGYYKSIELNFMIPGHTKFKCDGRYQLNHIFNLNAN
jgi:hypothetical protein